VTGHQQRIAIFGATSAIAAEMARLYAARGGRLFLAGRDPAKLRAIVDARGDAVAGHRQVDLTAPGAAADAVAASVEALGGGIDVAVIAHGWLGDQLASERDEREAHAIIDTNFLSVVALLVPLANHFDAAGAGHIAVLSSVAGDRGRPRNYTYGAAKGALNIYLQGVRTRLWPRGVGVHTLKLGPVDTPMTTTHRKTLLFARAGDVAAGIIAAIEAGRAEAYVPWFWRPIMAVVRNLPEPVLQRLPALSGR
jgi:decaprenylphospho-beta-D-erythro-pentofuranosid-2-ulose 2-reductase